MKIRITKDDILEFRQISNKRDDAQINQHILDAQLVDMQDILTDEMFNDFINDTLDADIWTGGTYTYDGKTFVNYGLRVVLIHYAYARYIYYGTTTDTAVNIVNQSYPNSQTISEKSKLELYTNNRQVAFRYWENVKRYLDRKNLYQTGCNNSTSSGFRISKIN